MGVPEPGVYRELLNSDAEIYGGSNMGNGGCGDAAADVPCTATRTRLQLVLPPLSCLILKKNS